MVPGHNRGSSLITVNHAGDRGIEVANIILDLSITNLPTVETADVGREHRPTEASLTGAE